MSREHKYKAYINNPIHGTGIFKVKSINFYTLVVTVVIPNGKYIDGIELTDEVQFFEGEVKLLEYTGVEDKNNKKVYETDVLQFQYRLLNGKYITVQCPVMYSMGEFGVMINEIETTDYYSLATLIGEVGQEFEVIGNIYKNPELSDNKEWLF